METVFQKSYFDCGATALANCFRILSDADYIDYKDIKQVAGTNRYSGTSKRGIVRCAKFYGFLATPYFQSNKNLAWKWLHRNASKYPCITLCDSGQHWAVIAGTHNGHVILVDPSDVGNGTGNAHYLSREEALDRLVDSNGKFYSIRVRSSR